MISIPRALATLFAWRRPEPEPETEETMREPLLRTLVVGWLLCEADHGVGEDEALYLARIVRYLKRAGFNKRVPWCAAMIDYAITRLTEPYGMDNPLEDVKHLALVQSYHDWATRNEALVLPSQVEHGDLAFFRFGSSGRWDHIEVVTHPPDDTGRFLTVGGNTSPGIGTSPDERERNGGGVYRKERWTGRSYPVTFARWAM